MTTDLVTVTIAFLLVTGRLYTKYFVTRSPGWEDCGVLLSHTWVSLRVIVHDIGCSVLALLVAVARVVGDSLGKYQFTRRSLTGLFHR